jgi:glycosyltransferase involved in cell wall biosynthesis
MKIEKKFRLCFVGNMLGRRAGYITTQGQITADLFAAEGYDVVCVSSKLNRAARLAEIVAALVKNRRRLDIVLVEVYSGLGFFIADVTARLCKALKLPLIMVLHGGNLPEFMQKHPHWTERVLRQAPRLVTPSAFLAEKIGARGFEINVISNVIDLNLYSFRERSRLSPRLIWMRSFHPIYNPEMALAVLAELRKIHAGTTLIMAGMDKGLEPQIKRRAAEMNLSGAVSFPGFLDARQKSELFSGSDIFLNTTRVDNMPVAVLEACAFGLAVVATNVGGLPFLIKHGENGLLVESEDARGMVEAINLLLKDSGLAQKLSRRARSLAERSAWNEVRLHWEKLFVEILNIESKEFKPRLPIQNLAAEKQEN